MIHSPNFTQCPNILFEYWMQKLSGSEWKVLTCLCRKIFGWHKQNLRDQVSISQIEEMTGMSRETVTIAIKSLEEYKLIIKIVSGEIGKQKTYYELHILEYPNSFYQSENPTPPQSENPTPPSRKIRPTKESSTKETALNKSGGGNISLESNEDTPTPKPAAASSEIIFYNGNNKELKSITRSDLHRHLVKFCVTPEMANKAIQKFSERKSPIGNPLKVIEYIVKDLIEEQNIKINIPEKKKLASQEYEEIKKPTKLKFKSF